MIVREIATDLWLFDQRDHSALCGAMAEAWGEPPFAPVPPSVQRAADIHDGGWPEWDMRPRLDPETGHPHPYSRMPGKDYRQIWRRGLERGWAAGATAGLLVSLHAMRFFGRKRDPADRDVYEEQRGRQAAALLSLGAPSPDVDELPEPFATWHAWMFWWDGLSLFLCEGWSSPWRHRVPSAKGEVELCVERQVSEGDGPGARVTVRPFPFRERLTLRASARVIPARRYTDAGALTAALASASHRTVDWAVEAAT